MRLLPVFARVVNCKNCKYSDSKTDQKLTRLFLFHKILIYAVDFVLSFDVFVESESI